MAKKKEGKLEWVSSEDFIPQKSSSKPKESQSERARRLNPDLNYGSTSSTSDNADVYRAWNQSEDDQEDF